MKTKRRKEGEGENENSRRNYEETKQKGKNIPKSSWLDGEDENEKKMEKTRRGQEIMEKASKGGQSPPMAVEPEKNNKKTYSSVEMYQINSLVESKICLHSNFIKYSTYNYFYYTSPKNKLSYIL